MNLIATKQEFRKLLKNAFHDLGGTVKSETFLKLEDQVNQNLLNFLQTQQGLWGAYQSLASEISIQKAFTQASHIRWAFPRTDGQDMAFYELGPQGFEQGDWAKQPVLAGARKVETCSGVIVPALGFDQVGRRLGRGKGFYDRFLANKMLLKVGVSLEALVVKELPAEEHDIGMDYIITEKSVRKIGK